MQTCHILSYPLFLHKLLSKKSAQQYNQLHQVLSIQSFSGFPYNNNIAIIYDIRHTQKVKFLSYIIYIVYMILYVPYKMIYSVQTTHIQLQPNFSYHVPEMLPR